jgi:hypothetical protein
VLVFSVGDDERAVAHVRSGDDADGTPPGLVLGPMLRYVSDTEATIWVETSRPAVVRVLDESASTFTVRGKHYGLVVVGGLEPGSTTPYEVHLDDEQVWPPHDDELPASVIRTTGSGAEVSVLVGSCRAAAPHEPPYTLEIATDERGRGVDTLWAHAVRMAGEDPADWPTLLVLAGDQVYADDSSPSARERIDSLRPGDSDLDASIVANFDEYCWLYHEAWSPKWERWLLSVVPTVMIFDDHDVIDDWNISKSWVQDMHHEPWWAEHALGSVMSYWIYQHLGNLSPAELAAEGLLECLVGADDATDIIEEWAVAVGLGRDEPYRFSFCRDVGPVRIVVIDSRHGRVFEESRRLMLREADWEWVRARALDHDGHVMLVTTLPVFIAPGLHDLHVWNERVCDGAWGRPLARWGERVRRSLDLEDWPAFPESFHAFVALLEDLCDRAGEDATVLVVAGDIHFSYVATVALGEPGCRVHQIVSSPIRNALIPPERGVLRFSLSRAGTFIGSMLRRSVRRPADAVPIEVKAGPYFANNMCIIDYDGPDVWVVVEQAVPDDDGGGVLNEVARVRL